MLTPSAGHSRVERDGHAANADNIYLTAGASSGISLIMNVAICPGDGVL